MTTGIDEGRLDDAAGLAHADPSDMLRAVATSAAQVRMSWTAARETGLGELTDGPRPRAVVVAGMGGSGIAGDVLAAIAGPRCPVPVVVHRGVGLPGWVGAADLLVAVSCSGATRETLAAVDDGVRRSVQLVGVGSADSPLAQRCVQARAPFVPITPQLSPRSSFWALSVPLLVVGARLGLLELGPDDAMLEDAATRLEGIAEVCRPDRESFVNPAKSLAVELAGSLPMVWGAGPVGPVAAYRMACQLAENAKQPAVVGALPEAHHNQVVTLDGPFAGARAEDDLFRDRVEEPDPVRLRLVLLHDGGGSPEPDAAVAASEEVARSRGVPATRLDAEGDSPVERLASLVGLTDYASVYLALLNGVDPTPIGPIDELKARLS